MVQRGKLPLAYFLKQGGCSGHGTGQFVSPFPLPPPIPSAAAWQSLHLPGPKGCSSTFPMERCPKNSCANLWGQSLSCGKGLSPRDGKLGKVNFACSTVGHKSAPLKIAFKEDNKSQCISYWHQLATINYSGMICGGCQCPIQGTGRGDAALGAHARNTAVQLRGQHTHDRYRLCPSASAPSTETPPETGDSLCRSPSSISLSELLATESISFLFLLCAVDTQSGGWTWLTKMSLSFCSDFQFTCP